MAKAFTEVWSFLALQNGKSVTGQRFGTRQLAEYLKQNSWQSAIEKWGKKLTKAVYEPYDFPEKVRYQTPEGGFKERFFKF